jgi:NAD(P)-dependent dehydrogenase (short-subunit alcohol dehydrogenase family)
MHGKTVLITGANAGIGFATALGLASMGARVVMVARNRQRGEVAQAAIQQKTGNDDVHLLLADLSEMAQVRALAADFRARFDALHVLMNNAAVIPQQRTESPDGYEMQLAVNHLAYFLLTNLLLDMLINSAPARIVNVSSGVHFGGKINFDDLHSKKSYRPTGVYANTKLMNVLFTYELARRLTGRGVTVNALHPGEIATQLHNDWYGEAPGTPFFGRPIEDGARTPIYVATSPELAGVTGRYFSNERETRGHADDVTVAARLWQGSADLTGL